jgi:hypothetical protein
VDILAQSLNDFLDELENALDTLKKGLEIEFGIDVSVTLTRKTVEITEYEYSY